MCCRCRVQKSSVIDFFTGQYYWKRKKKKKAKQNKFCCALWSTSVLITVGACCYRRRQNLDRTNRITNRITNWITDRITNWITYRLKDWITDRIMLVENRNFAWQAKSLRDMMKCRPHWNFSSAQNPIIFTAISRSVVKCHHERRQARCMYHFIVKKNATQSRSLSFFHCRRMRYVGSYNSQTDRPKSSTLQRIPTIFNQQEVISVTFGLSRIPFNNIRVSRLLQFSGGA